MWSKLNSLYYKGYILIFITGLIAVWLQEHGDFVLFVNRNRTGFLDFIMPYTTLVGDGLFFGSVIAIVLIYKWRMGILYAVTGILTLILSGFLKRIVFKGYYRPKKYFGDEVELNFIDGVEVHGNHSFPSGHTMSAFAMFTLFSLTFLRKEWASILILALAWLIGFSRIYLLQHFLSDVIAGSFIGVIIATSTFLLMKNWSKADQLF